MGAGAALPSLVCCRLAAEFVLITDYPDTGILNNIKFLLSQNGISVGAAVLGHIWGDDVSSMLTAHSGDCSTSIVPNKFDIIIMAELLWKDTYLLHEKLLTSASQCLSPGGIILVSFAKRPVPSDSGLSSQTRELKPHDDNDFFSLAAKSGFEVVQLVSVQKNDVCSSSSEMIEVTITSLTKIPT